MSHSPGPHGIRKIRATALLLGLAAALLASACASAALPSPEPTSTALATPSPAPVPGLAQLDGSGEKSPRTGDKPAQSGDMPAPQPYPDLRTPVPPGAGGMSGGSSGAGVGSVAPAEPGYWQQLDLMPGEIAAVGRLVQEGKAVYLETPAGRIMLEGNVPVQGPKSGPGPAGPADGSRPSAEPVHAPSDMLATGKWRVENGQLVLTARTVRPWAPAPSPPTPTVLPRGTPPAATATPLVQPGNGFGTLYGQVRIGPLCPVEPCRNPSPDVYSSRSLLLETASGETVSIPLFPDGWFKAPVKAGTYVVSLTNCSFLGCKSALPARVAVIANQATELQINIDTGIR